MAPWPRPRSWPTRSTGRAFPSVGFSGLFFPVLEDSVLAARAAEGRLTVNDLLLYCTVCGAGLDTVPLPGAVDRETLAGILADVGALVAAAQQAAYGAPDAHPGKQAGDDIHFDFAYFADSRVLATRDFGLGGFFVGDEAGGDWAAGAGVRQYVSMGVCECGGMGDRNEKRGGLEPAAFFSILRLILRDATG